ncbi:MAG: HlyD family efflux transporter periplasmic adaptor subunit [Proteobacteria bacterium]|nr:HlyD family efflux transporter periplasmic adaptor subunit [Pseudomonadota bacterium]NOG61123.1 HlyD family efflux transporter periplasmic adaptor subunit [Pseudomonadota bacterium]
MMTDNNQQTPQASVANPATPQVPDITAVSKLLQLESMARAASSAEALQFMIVNETRRLVPYRQAYLFLSAHPIKRDCKLVAASSIAIVEKNAPFATWLEKLLEKVFTSETISTQRLLDVASCPEELKEGWNEFSLPFVLWTPLKMPDGTFIGGLWTTREVPWQENELPLLKRLGETYGHAYVAVTSRKDLYHRPKTVTVAVWVIIVFLLLVFVKPIKLSALAPAEVIAKEPVVVSSPMDGVISEIEFSPNTHVSKGETLFVFEDTNLRNEYNVAEKTLAVAEAEYRKAAQGSFGDTKSKAQVSLLQAQTELHKSKLKFARELLDKITVKAEKSGLLIYSDKSDWIGKPVQVGERVMEIADTDKIQLKVNLAINDAIVLREGAKVEVFLDANPLHAIEATVNSTSYLAEKYSQDTLSYRVYAEFDDIENEKLRIGLQGTAKMYGERVSVFFYLFRRPISYVRQLLGI